MQHRLLDARTGDGVVLGRIAAADEKARGVLDVVEGICRRAGAEGLLHAGGGRRVADAGAAIHVVRAEHDTGELLREIVLLVRPPRRAEDAEAVGAGFLDDAAEVVRDALDGFGPRDFAPFAGLANHRLSDTVSGVRKVEGVAAFHAEMTFAHRRVEHGLHLHDAAFARADAHLTAHAAIGTGRPRPLHRHAVTEDGLILQRARRTGVGARAATHAGTGEQGRPVRHDARIMSRPGDVPDELSLHFVADAHATEAVDALAEVGGEVGVGEIRKTEPEARRNSETRNPNRRRGLALGFGLRTSGFFRISGFGFRTYPVSPQPPVKLLLRPALHRFCRIIFYKQSQEGASRLLDFGRVGFDLHPVGHRRGAGGHEVMNPLRLHQTETTRARRLEPVVVTERRDFDASEPRGLQYGRAVRHFEWATVDAQFHNTNCARYSVPSGRCPTWKPALRATRCISWLSASMVAVMRSSFSSRPTCTRSLRS